MSAVMNYVRLMFLGMWGRSFTTYNILKCCVYTDGSNVRKANKRTEKLLIWGLQLLVYITPINV